MLPTSHFCMIFPTVMNLPSGRWRVQLQKNRSALSNLCSFVFEPLGQNELIVWKSVSRFLFSLAAHSLRACEARARGSHAALILL